MLTTSASVSRTRGLRGELDAKGKPGIELSIDRSSSPKTALDLTALEQKQLFIAGKTYDGH